MANKFNLRPDRLKPAEEAVVRGAGLVKMCLQVVSLVQMSFVRGLNISNHNLEITNSTNAKYAKNLVCNSFI